MSRVNHRKVKQLIAQKRKTIRDRQFFTSRILAGHFADIGAAQTRRYGYNRMVKMRIVWEPGTDCLAYTENELIWINAGHSMVTCKKTRQDRYDMVCGLFTHELGHVLYTDFLAVQTYLLRFEAGKWFPENPLLRSTKEQRHEADMWAYCMADPKHMHIMQMLIREVHNVLEDGYVDSKMLNRYPGVLGYSLRVLLDTHYEQAPTMTQLIEKETDGGHIWLSILQTVLSYMLWGQIKYGDEPLTDERIQTVFSLIPELDTALIVSSSRERWNVVNAILIRCWIYIKDFLEYCEKLHEDTSASGTETTASDLVSQLISAMEGTSRQANGTTEPVHEKGSDANMASAAANRTETAKQAAAALESIKTGESIQSEEANEVPEDGESTQQAENVPLNSESYTSDEKPVQQVSPEETTRIPLHQTDRLFEPGGGETEYDDVYQGSGYANAADDIERLLDRVAEASVHTQLEKERVSELNDLAQGISYGNIHSGVSVKIHRMTDVSDELKEQYKKIAPELLHISKQLQRSIIQQLHDKRCGGKQVGLLMGRRLDIHALPRNDGRVFYKNALPNETPRLAIGLLLDESGSMSGYDRATYARASAIILYDFCRALDIPVLVYGHSTSGISVDLYSYAEFVEIDRDDCYRMMDISSRQSNRDGAALRYVAERLSRRNEDIRILILVSDGQPAHTGYGGTAAEDDLRGIKKEYQRKGLHFIAAAIGEDKENIERIFGNSFMDITDLKKLPLLLTNVVKRFIKV